MYWLTRHYKQYPVPLMGYDDTLPYSAHYDLESNAIVLGQCQSASTIAHEYRHHIQFCRGCKFVNSPQVGDFDYFDYWEERDALLFEIALTGGDSTALHCLDRVKRPVPTRLEAVDFWLW